MKHLKKFDFALFESIKDKNTVKTEIENYFMNLIDKGRAEISFSEDNYVYKGTTIELSFKESYSRSYKFSDKQLNKLKQLQKGFYPCYLFQLLINKSVPMQSLLKYIERLENDGDFFVFDIDFTITQKWSNSELKEHTGLSFYVTELEGRVDKVEDLPEVFRKDNEDYNEVEEEYEEEEEEYEEEEDEEDEEDEGN